jgi:hypothetical protein
MLTFVETTHFTKLIQEYLTDDQYAVLQRALVASMAGGRTRQARRDPSDLLPPHVTR